MVVTEGMMVPDPVTVAHWVVDRVAVGQADRDTVEEAEGQKVPEVVPHPDPDTVDVNERVGERLAEIVGLNVVEAQ